MDSNATKSSGIGLTGAVFIVFLVLKLTETGAVARWSWWWVTSPIWIPLALCLAALAVVLAVAGIALAIEAVRK